MMRSLLSAALLFALSLSAVWPGRAQAQEPEPTEEPSPEPTEELTDEPTEEPTAEVTETPLGILQETTETPEPTVTSTPNAFAAELSTGSTVEVYREATFGDVTNGGLLAALIAVQVLQLAVMVRIIHVIRRQGNESY